MPITAATSGTSQTIEILREVVTSASGTVSPAGPADAGASA
jgi:hypothetical protein